MRQATVIVSDEFTYTLNGKQNVFGMYTGEIQIPSDPFIGHQLVFLFVIETSPDDPYQRLALHVELPGGDSRNLELPINKFVPGISDQRRWCLKYPLLFSAPILRPGPIEAKVIHEQGEISTAAPFISLSLMAAALMESKH
jgi:hypothetical protein